MRSKAETRRATQEQFVAFCQGNGWLVTRETRRVGKVGIMPTVVAKLTCLTPEGRLVFVIIEGDEVAWVKTVQAAKEPELEDTVDLWPEMHQ
jgi:hypothetical protein